jgi:hypothetical protein
MFLGRKPGTSDYFPVICQCSGDIGVCGWSSFTQICGNVVTNGNGRAGEDGIRSGEWAIVAPTRTLPDDSSPSAYTYIYFKAKAAETLSVEWDFERIDTEDFFSYPFFVVTDSDPANYDGSIPLAEFFAVETLQGTLPCDQIDEKEFCDGTVQIDITQGQYYVFGVDTFVGTEKPLGAELDLEGLPSSSSCVADGWVSTTAMTSSHKNKREKRTKRVKHTRPPTRKHQTKPSHARV